MSIRRVLLTSLPTERLAQLCVELELDVDGRSRDALLQALLADRKVSPDRFIGQLTDTQLKGALRSSGISPAVVRGAMEQQAFQLAGGATLLKFALLCQLRVNQIKRMCDELGLKSRRSSSDAKFAALLSSADVTPKRLTGVVDDEQLRMALEYAGVPHAAARADMEAQALATQVNAQSATQTPTRRRPAQEAPAEPASEGDAELRAARFAQVEVRSQQSVFRNAVYRACNGRCVVSGCSVPEALEAAHVKGRRWRLGHNTAKDGILLRRDLHALYDRGLLQIDADGLVVLDASVRLYYGEFEGVASALKPG